MAVTFEKLAKLASKKGKMGAVAKYLKSKSEDVRTDALKALGYCGTEDAINLLTNWSYSENPAERLAAVTALGMCGKEYSMTQMRYQMESETVPEVKEALRAAIAAIRERIAGQA